MILKYGDYAQASTIYRASQVGQDGRSASLTAPNGPAQEEIISRRPPGSEDDPTGVDLLGVPWHRHFTWGPHRDWSRPQDPAKGATQRAFDDVK